MKHLFFTAILIGLATGCAVGVGIEPYSEPPHPRHVWIDPTFTPDQKAAIHQVMLNWETTTQTRFDEVSSISDSVPGNIIIDNTVHPAEVEEILQRKGRFTVGWTTGTFKMGMRVQIMSDQIRPKTIQRFKYTATHELGHCLGLRFTAPESKRTVQDPNGDTIHCTDDDRCKSSYMTPLNNDVTGPIDQIDIEAFKRHPSDFKELGLTNK